MGQICGPQNKSVDEEAVEIAYIAASGDLNTALQRIDEYPFKDNLDNILKIDHHGSLLRWQQSEEILMH